MTDHHAHHHPHDRPQDGHDGQHGHSQAILWRQIGLFVLSLALVTGLGIVAAQLFGTMIPPAGKIRSVRDYVKQQVRQAALRG